MLNKLKSYVFSATGRAVLVSFLFSILAKFSQLGFSVLAARILQPTGFGIFTFAVGIGLLGGRVAGLGAPMLASRFIPKYKVDAAWDQLRGLLYSIHLISFVGSVLIALGFYLGSELIADRKLAQGLLYGALLLPVVAFRNLYRSVLSAFGKPQKGIIVDELIPAALMLVVLIFLLQATDVNPFVVTSIYAAAGVVAVVAGGLWAKKSSPSELHYVAPDFSNVCNWVVIALPGMVGMSARLFMNKSDVLMLAPLGTMEDVGLYGAALRATYPQTFAMAVLSTVLTAKLSEAIASGATKRAKLLLSGSLSFALLSSGIIAVFMMLFDGTIMSLLYGDAYVNGAAILTVLSVSQVAAALSIPASSLMLLVGRQVLFGKVTSAALVLNVVLNYFLIPEYGGLGAAYATCISVCLLCVVQMFFCYMFLVR